VSTDHVSWPLERKTREDFHANASGVPGLEVLYPLLLQGCLERGLPPTWVARLLASQPAQLFNLTATKGALTVGCDADITVLEPAHVVYDPVATGHGVARWSPYAGLPLHWRVAGTWLRGRLAFDGRRVLSRSGDGRFIAPSVP